MAIVATILIIMIALFLSHILSLFTVLSFFCAGLIVAITGFLDDHGHIAARWRLLAHFAAAAIGLAFLNHFPLINIFQHDVSLNTIGMIIGLIYLVWMLNLYNFMDGINGLASAEAITFAISSALILYLNIPNFFSTDEFILSILLGGAVFGFMLWNFPKARIFMGDAGSGFLGIFIGLFVLHIANLNSQFFFAEICILGVFIVDATVTLICRVLKGKKFYEAHASHCYQILARKYNDHKPVTIAVTMINVVWLLPIALLIASGIIDGIIGIVIAWTPLILISLKCGAGIKDKDTIGQK
ncbi:hypothetical protein [Vagococcus sp. WN89Y]|uniref:hypothetical protein n=1 Tax=Vagococcus sp. WN89Y TaxID=3457258 RepID=UPI003FCCD613